MSECHRRGSLLVIDDEPMVLELLRTVLQDDGYSVTCCASGADALRLLEAGRFDAVISDFALPGLDGIALHQLLVEAQSPLAARMLLITGDVACSKVETFVSATGVCFLNKPFRNEDLLGRVEGLLESERQPPGPG